MLKGKKIVVGVTGSIAAYKTCLIIRSLIRREAEAQAVITPAGKHFITPLTLSTLTRRPVVCEFFDKEDGTWHSHVDLGVWADAMLIAPCTASTMAKMASGTADNMLTTTYLSMKAPVFIAPAMDADMYAHPSTQRNIATLRSYGNHIIEPGSGFLASGLEGKGRMAEPDAIVDVIDEYFNSGRESTDRQRNSLRGKKILITAGPTYEKIDPVRFIGNYSSGKMGFALARECASRHAEVTLISGPVCLPTPDPSIHRIDVECCEEMYGAAVKAFPGSDAAILCAAVADFKPETTAMTKIKRESGCLTLRLQPTHDIAAQLGTMKRQGQRLVGFALETDNEECNAAGKLERKNFDFIVLNSTRNAGTTFRSDYNKVSIITRDGATQYGKKPKNEVASDIIDKLAEIM